MKMIEEINNIRNEKRYPEPEIFPDIYIDYNICPICYKDASSNSLIHPNDINKKIKIHNRCWDFIRSTWKCSSCKNYFPKSEGNYRICGMGSMCMNCYENYKIQMEIYNKENDK